MQIVFSIFNRIGYDLPNYKCAALAISNNGNIQTIYESPSLYMGHVVERLCRSFHRKIIADIICGSCCVNSCFFLVINPSVQYETKWVSERSVWMLRSDALLRYSFFYRGDNDYRNSSVSFCNAAPLLISDFFSAPLAKQKETRYNMTERTKLVIFKEAWAWLLPITRLNSSARRC